MLHDDKGRSTDNIRFEIIDGRERLRVAESFINEDLRATCHKLATGKLPGGKEGSQWVASKRVLEMICPEAAFVGRNAAKPQLAKGAWA